MKFKIYNISKLSKLNKNDVNLKTLIININLLVKNLFMINLINIKPMTNTINHHNNLLLNLNKDKIKKNTKTKNYIISAPKKNNYYIIIPNIL